jgi:uncharacterized protein YidB (DUF937 family)
MGAFDSIMAKLPGLTGDQIQSLAKGLMDDPSKLTGLVQDLDVGGLGDQVRSWIGTGDNQSVTADQVKQALPQEKLEEIAAARGVTTDQAAQGISTLLPDLVDQLTPDGELPTDEALKARLAGLAGG